MKETRGGRKGDSSLSEGIMIGRVEEGMVIITSSRSRSFVATHPPFPRPPPPFFFFLQFSNQKKGFDGTRPPPLHANHQGTTLSPLLDTSGHLFSSPCGTLILAASSSTTPSHFFLPPFLYRTKPQGHGSNTVAIIITACPAPGPCLSRFAAARHIRASRWRVVGVERDATATVNVSLLSLVLRPTIHTHTYPH